MLVSIWRIWVYEKWKSWFPWEYLTANPIINQVFWNMYFHVVVRCGNLVLLENLLCFTQRPKDAVCDFRLHTVDMWTNSLGSATFNCAFSLSRSKTHISKNILWRKKSNTVMYEIHVTCWSLSTLSRSLSFDYDYMKFYYFEKLENALYKTLDVSPTRKEKKLFFVGFCICVCWCVCRYNCIFVNTRTCVCKWKMKGTLHCCLLRF